MKHSTYISTDHTYSDPKSYDDRKNKPLEKYLDSLWKPIIASIGTSYITPQDIVCDFGCGTLGHYNAVQQARHIYAIDTNSDMLTYGLQKVPTDERSHITPIITSATDTGLAPQTCSVVWSIGLTEYVDLDELFAEMSRVSAPGAKLLLQFPNAYHPMHLIIRYISPMLGKKSKKFRSLSDVQEVARKFGWTITKKYTTGFYTPTPAFLIPILSPVWKLFNNIGNNIFIVATKSTSL